MTSAEARLWHHLRARRFAGFKFRRQVPVGTFIVDFVCWSAKLIVEVDGATHGTSAEQAYDRQRTAALTAMGFRVVRVTNEEIRSETGAVLAFIHHEVSSALGHQTPFR